MGFPPNSWDGILGQQPVISCFWNWEGRATEEEPAPVVDSEVPPGRGKWVLTGHGGKAGAPFSWTAWNRPAEHTHSLLSFLEGAKHPGKQNGQLHSLNEVYETAKYVAETDQYVLGSEDMEIMKLGLVRL